MLTYGDWPLQLQESSPLNVGMLEIFNILSDIWFLNV